MAAGTRRRARRPLTARTTAYGWACQVGAGGGLCAAAAADAAEQGHDRWAMLFALLVTVCAPVYYALQWRELQP